MTEHYHLYHILQEDKKRNPLSPHKKRRIKKALRQFQKLHAVKQRKYETKSR